MLHIIVLIVAGSAIAYISQSNLEPVTVVLGQYVIRDIPLFYVIAGSLLTGLVFAYAVQIASTISHSFALRSKKREINTAKSEVASLTKRVHQLELENEQLKHGAVTMEPEDVHAL